MRERIFGFGYQTTAAPRGEPGQPPILFFQSYSHMRTCRQTRRAITPAMDCFDLTVLRRASVLLLDLWNFAKRYAEVLADSFNKGVNKVKDTPPSFTFAAEGSFIRSLL